jgi:hypothetical protein
MSRTERALLLVQIGPCCALSCVNSVHPLVATVTPFWRRDDSSQMLLSQATHCTEQEEASDRQAE